MFDLKIQHFMIENQMLKWSGVRNIVYFCIKFIKK